MSKSSESSASAGRYGIALYEVASDSNLIDKIADELKVMKKLISESQDFLKLIKNPVFSRDEQTTGVFSISDSIGFSKITRNFLGLLARNRRLFVLSEIINSYEEIYATRKGQVTVEVTTAIELTEEQLKSLSVTLEESIGSKIDMVVIIDPKILGGLIISMGSRMFDSSIKSKIKRLGLSMKGIA